MTSDSTATTIGGVVADGGTDAHGESLVSVRGVRLSYGSTVVLAGIDLEVGAGAFVTLLGPSGSGKTTLLRIIAGFAEPDAGDVLVAGRSILRDAPERRPVNTVFQNYALFPHLSVWKNIAFGLEVSRVPAREVRQRVDAAIEMVRLGGLEKRRVDELSGGQQQRVALGRAVVNRPAVLLLDEPLGALDLKLRREMQLELRALQRELAMTFIYVTHDQEEALVLSDSIAVMKEGEIAQMGSPVEIYDRPRSRFVAEFIGETNLLPGTAAREEAVVEGIEAPIPAPGVSDGPILVCVRPEDLHLTGEGPLRLAGTVVDSVFMGADVRLVIRVAEHLSLTLLARDPALRLARIAEQVEVSWRAQDCAVVPA